MKVWPSVSFLALSILIFYFLTIATQTIPLGTSYAVWTGIGALGTAVVGIFFYGATYGLTYFLPSDAYFFDNWSKTGHKLNLVFI